MERSREVFRFEDMETASRVRWDGGALFKSGRKNYLQHLPPFFN